MSRRRKNVNKGSIYLVEVYVKSEKSQFESNEFYIYYLHRGTLRRETGLEWKGHTHAWAARCKERSIKGMLRKFDSDFQNLRGLFDSYEIQVTKVGEL